MIRIAAAFYLFSLVCLITAIEFYPLAWVCGLP